MAMMDPRYRGRFAQFSLKPRSALLVTLQPTDDDNTTGTSLIHPVPSWTKSPQHVDLDHLMIPTVRYRSASPVSSTSRSSSPDSAEDRVWSAAGSSRSSRSSSPDSTCSASCRCEDKGDMLMGDGAKDDLFPIDEVSPEEESKGCFFKSSRSLKFFPSDHKTLVEGWAM